jgi:hypothetical protein
MEGVIEIRKTKNGKFYPRMVHENGNILWHGPGKLKLGSAINDAQNAAKAALMQDKHGRSPYLEIWSNKNGDPYFRIKKLEGKGYYGWSESYSDRSKCTQGKDAALRIFKQHAANPTPFEFVP